MATHNAIAAIGQAILGLLASACPRPEFAAAQFELYQGRQFQTPLDEGPPQQNLWGDSGSGSRPKL
jgi:hypothetical protein